ncbi:MAG: 7-carboxy-7-deazaguanine synthase QueE [Candidatus Omnitrophica bacterium]|nr:7-carboxy-7-deazaguanine synthase QueE [Candidatus Omnitrophota bacterium]
MKQLFDTKTEIHEIYSSIQGEGLYIGESHLFIRFKKCNLHCVGCDEIHTAAQNLSIDEVIKTIRAIDDKKGPHRFIALTGGEPLCEGDYLETLCSELFRYGYDVLLETNGTLFNELQKIIHYCAAVSMDIKLSSVWKVPNCFNQHDKFLENMKGCNGYIKITISNDVLKDEFMDYINLIFRRDKSIPVFLQPFIHTSGSADENIFCILRDLQQRALHILPTVRILAPIHKILHIR